MPEFKPTADVEKAQREATEAAKAASAARAAADKAIADSGTPEQKALKAANAAANLAEAKARDAADALVDARARAALERKLGRKLVEGEYVFHVNGNKSDNKRANIEVRSPLIDAMEKQSGRHVDQEDIELGLVRYPTGELLDKQLGRRATDAEIKAAEAQLAPVSPGPGPAARIGTP